MTRRKKESQVNYSRENLMVNRFRLSGVLFFISTVLLMYAYWFEVRLSLELMAVSWSLLALSRSLVMFPKLTSTKAEVKIGKEIKQ
ncbi:MAG: hypothetical protein BWY36_00863 [Candidatus Diapherotrites archaeon ADurb.Bin253]|nr:MAG: hypothetical protein BWY36_00863 [Candidatus Diapherotrites archaeon ADurb.Bin253]